MNIILFVVLVAVCSIQVVNGQENLSLQEKVNSLEKFMNSTYNWMDKMKINHTKQNFDLNYTAMLKLACESPEYSHLLNSTELASCEGLK